MTNTTIVTTPNYLTPINDLYGSVFTLTNASSGSTNFKYLTKLYYGTNEVTPDVQFLVKETQIPRPNTGYGIYSPYKSLLAVSGYDLNQGITSSVGGLGSADLLYYYINYGLQWNPELVWTTLLSVTSGTYSYFGFSFSSAHGLAVGDVITINTSNSYLAGTAAVTNTLFTTTRFSTDRIFVTASATSIGSITNVERWNGTKTNMLFIEKSIFLLTNIIVSPIITPIYIIYYYAYNLEISLRKENIDNYIDSKNPTKMFNFKIIRK